MACVNPDGTLAPSAITILSAATAPGSAAELSERTHFPLFRIRASLRELVAAGLLLNQDERYRLTPLGDEKSKQ